MERGNSGVSFQYGRRQRCTSASWFPVLVWPERQQTELELCVGCRAWWGWGVTFAYELTAAKTNNLS
jgi:hypothetical protein